MPFTFSFLFFSFLEKLIVLFSYSFLFFTFYKNLLCFSLLFLSFSHYKNLFCLLFYFLENSIVTLDFRSWLGRNYSCCCSFCSLLFTKTYCAFSLSFLSFSVSLFTFYKILLWLWISEVDLEGTLLFLLLLLPIQ